jgi:nucleolar GTP-binding protein
MDIILSKTQRQTPTVVHPGYAISRIRQFYMRKVRYTQQSATERLSKILDEFPRLDDIHPFYSDLINVLYDRDHYKLALGQINAARSVVENIGKDYLRLLKFGDSLYRCKQLKRAALGRMCTALKKLTASLAYLEQVRQHLSRLPSIDPNTRTLLLCGYPNVGKSSFMNTVTRANVEVQPYAFTTKSLFVGHMDYKYLRWQVIDTPGVLDRPLEERNTVEMQSITAIAHLRASVLYIVDISEQCGWSIAQQIQLFESIQPLFANKPLFVAINKIDLRKYEDLNDEEKQLIEKVEKSGATVMFMSTASGEGVSELKMAACEKLLEKRVEQKLQGSKIDSVVNRIHVAEPSPRDDLERGTNIPDSVLNPPDMKIPRKTEKELMLENGGAGVYSVDITKNYMLESGEWKTDRIPEIMDGFNIADFVDPDILARLEELEREEEANANEMEEEEVVDDLTPEQEEALKAIREKKTKLIVANRMKISNPIPRSRKTPSSAKDFENHLQEMGIRLSEDARTRIRSRSRSRGPSQTAPARRKRGRSEMDEDNGEEGERKLTRSESRARSMSITSVRKGEGYRNVKQKVEAVTKQRKAQFALNKAGKASESDRKISTTMPKHLFAGKRGVGKTDRR